MSARTCFGLTGKKKKKKTTGEEGPQVSLGVGDDSYIPQHVLCRLEPASRELLPGHDRDLRGST